MGGWVGGKMGCWKEKDSCKDGDGEGVQGVVGVLGEGCGWSFRVVTPTEMVAACR